MEKKLCKDCNHYRSYDWKCKHPQAVKDTDLVHGDIIRWYAENFRIYGDCGREAKNFEPIPPPLTFGDCLNSFFSFFNRKK